MPDPLRVAIVDDEPLAHEGLRLRLLALGGVEIALELGDAEEAAAAIPGAGVEVLFLDIQMPGLDGFDLLARLERGPLPMVVFVTAYAEHAVRAFRAGAVDYLVKPYDDETLAESLGRARAQVARARAESREAVGDGYSDRLILRSGRELVVVRASELEWLESAGDHVRLHAGPDTPLVRSTLEQMERRLDPRRFVRIHRTTIVALAHVRGLEPYSRGEHVVVMRDGRRLPLSRRFRVRVLEALAGAGDSGAPGRPPSRLD